MKTILKSKKIAKEAKAIMEAADDDEMIGAQSAGIDIFGGAAARRHSAALDEIEQRILKAERVARQAKEAAIQAKKKGQVAEAQKLEDLAKELEDWIERSGGVTARGKIKQDEPKEPEREVEKPSDEEEGQNKAPELEDEPMDANDDSEEEVEGTNDDLADEINDAEGGGSGENDLINDAPFEDDPLEDSEGDDSDEEEDNEDDDSDEESEDEESEDGEPDEEDEDSDGEDEDEDSDDNGSTGKAGPKANLDDDDDDLSDDEDGEDSEGSDEDEDSEEEAGDDDEDEDDERSSRSSQQSEGEDEEDEEDEDEESEKSSDTSKKTSTEAEDADEESEDGQGDGDSESESEGDEEGEGDGQGESSETGASAESEASDEGESEEAPEEEENGEEEEEEVENPFEEEPKHIRHERVKKNKKGNSSSNKTKKDKLEAMKAVLKMLRGGEKAGAAEGLKKILADRGVKVEAFSPIASQSLTEAYLPLEKAIGEMSSTEFDDIYDKALDIIDSIYQTEYTDGKEARAKKIKDDDTAMERNKMDQEDRNNQITDKKNKAARQGEINKYSTNGFRTQDAFIKELELAIATQVKKLRVNKKSWGAINRRHGGDIDDVILPGRIVKDQDNNEAVKLTMYLDCSGSFSESDIREERAFVSGLKQYVDEGSLIIDIVYFSVGIHPDFATARANSGNVAGDKIVENIKETNPTNIVFVTDSDLDWDMRAHGMLGQKIYTPGFVWYIWKRSASPETTKAIRGMQGTSQFQLV